MVRCNRSKKRLRALWACLRLRAVLQTPPVDTTVDGNPAISHVYSLVTTGELGIRIKQMEVYTIKGNMMYQFIFVSTLEDYPTYLPIFMKILQYLKISN